MVRQRGQPASNGYRVSTQTGGPVHAASSTKSTTKDPRDAAHAYYVMYKRHATAVALLWAVFTCCFVVLNVVVFVQPQWVRKTPADSSTPNTNLGTKSGYFGLWEICTYSSSGSGVACSGRFDNFPTIPNSNFRAATWFIGVSCLVLFLCILLFILFFFVRPAIVFIVCGALQSVSALFMFLGCIIFPAGWNDELVQEICGTGADKYLIAGCTVDWAYILAIIGIFDAIFLAVLAFILAGRQADWPEQTTVQPTFVRVTDQDDHPTMSGSKASVFIQPTVGPPAAGVGDTDSEASFKAHKQTTKKGEFSL